jgi:hypothetical protein
MSDYYTCRNHYRSLDYASIVLFLYIYTAYGVRTDHFSAAQFTG